MNCLIIGASSYIAQAFIKHYKEQITITAISRNNQLKSYFDLTDEEFIGYDVLINFAAIVHQIKPDAKLAYTINTELPIFLATKAKDAGMKQFVQMSTIAVYNPKATYIDQTSKTNPATVYGKTKLAADSQLIEMQNSDFTVSIIRPPIVYGYDAPGNMHSLISLLQRGIPLPFLYKNNQRAILYIDNLTTALYQVMLQQADGVFILRDEYSPSLSTLCTEINQQLQKQCILFTPPTFLIKLLIRFKQLPFYKLYGDLRLDDSFTQQRIGKYSKTTLTDALEKTIKGALC